MLYYLMVLSSNKNNKISFEIKEKVWLGLLFGCVCPCVCAAVWGWLWCDSCWQRARLEASEEVLNKAVALWVATLFSVHFPPLWKAAITMSAAIMLTWKKIAQANYSLSCSVSKKGEDWETEKLRNGQRHGNDSSWWQIKSAMLILRC